MCSTRIIKINQFLFEHILWSNWEIPKQTADKNITWIESLLDLVTNPINYAEWKFFKARQQFNGADIKISVKDYTPWPLANFKLVPLSWFWQHTPTYLHSVVRSVNLKQGEWMPLLNLLQNWFYLFGVSRTQTRFILRVGISFAHIPFPETNNKTNDSRNTSTSQKYWDYAGTFPFDKSSFDRDRSLQMASRYRAC